MKHLAFGFVAIVAAWTAGFVLFIRGLPEPPARTELQAEGIAVFTGGGGARITAAMEIFKNGDGKRLLISGVNPETSRERLSSLWTGDAEQFECCVDLGRQAQSTRGNADELKSWVTEKDYQSVILVTSEYHMPRALLVTQTRMPDVKVRPFAIKSGLLNERRRPATFDAVRKIAGEYSKYLIAKIQTLTG